MTLLEVSNLKVSFRNPYKQVCVVNGVSFSIDSGETVALVGESGSGKSVTAHALLSLLPKRISTISGEAIFDGKNLLCLTEREKNAIRGGEIGIVCQDPMTALNPTMKVGKQIAEAIRRHRHVRSSAAKRLAIEMLRRVGIAQPEKRYHQYPHEFSGGMRQRALIAMAMACEPRLLIADEPTTALDVTIQGQLLDLMKELQAELGVGILLITHDLGVVAGFCDRLLVMYAGEIVEEGAVEAIFKSPRHPYTKALLESIPYGKSSHTSLKVIEGSPPSPHCDKKGCAFAPRCKYAMGICHQEKPPSIEGACCWLYDERAKKQKARYEGIFQ